jgi:hypothetical protein
VSLEVVLIALGIGIAGVAIVFALIALAPARTLLELDSAKGLAHMRVRPLWGLAAETEFIRNRGNSKKSRVGNILKRIRGLPRMAHAALIAPKLVTPVKQLLKDIGALKPKVSTIVVFVNAGHPLANLLIEIAQELKAASPLGFEIRGREGLGLDLTAHIEANASPLTLWSVYRRFRTEPNVQEFLRRLHKESEPKPPR